jgi:hypothetical protein
MGCILALFDLSSFSYADPSPSPSVSGAAAPKITAPKITAKDQQDLLTEFNRAQRYEMKALNHRYKFENKELKISHENRRKEWERKEREARHKFFEEHPKGAERREYVANFIKRREEFQKTIKEELTQHTQEQERHLKDVQKTQAENLKTFRKELLEGKAPSGDLWPKSGQ